MKNQVNQEKNQKYLIPEEVILDMNEHLPGRLTMEDIQTLRRGKNLRVPFLITDEMMQTDILNLELSVRSSNALKRAGFHTVGALLLELDSFEELTKIRNCGKTSISEIKGKMLVYQYSLIKKENRAAYMKRLLELNGIR